MKKITIVALHLGYGGIEQAITSLANIFANEYEINIISTYQLYDQPVFKINDKVKITYLTTLKPNKKALVEALKKLHLLTFFKEVIMSIKVLYLKRQLMIKALVNLDSNIVISTRPYHHALVGKYVKEGSIKIAWEHSHHNNSKQYIKELVTSCHNMNYLISVSQDLNSFYTGLMPDLKCLCIYPALDYQPTELAPLNAKEITFIGRLSKEKGLVDLIDVFKLVNIKKPDWHLNIIGDGTEREKLINKIKEDNLENVITLPGFKNKDELKTILLQTSLYVMTSFTESFGLVLIEAMAYGIPCLAFDSAQGANEIIDNQVNGYLIPDRNKEAMASALLTLINDLNLRKEMGSLAHAKSLSYSPSMIKQEWVNIFNK